MKGQGISADILEYRGLYSCVTLIGALAMPSHGEHGDPLSDGNAKIII